MRLALWGSFLYRDYPAVVEAVFDWVFCDDEFAEFRISELPDSINLFLYNNVLKFER